MFASGKQKTSSFEHVFLSERRNFFTNNRIRSFSQKKRRLLNFNQFTRYTHYLFVVSVYGMFELYLVQNKSEVSCSFIVYLLLTVLKVLAVSSFVFSKDISSIVEEGLLWDDWLSISFFSVLIREGVELRTAQKMRNKRSKHERRGFESPATKFSQGQTQT